MNEPVAERGEAWGDLGRRLRKSGQLVEAAAAFACARTLLPDHVGILHNLATSLHRLGQPRQALILYDRVVALQPDHAHARWNRALALLTIGDFANGWRDYEWRWTGVGMAPHWTFTNPPWQGGALEDRTILVHGEQGLGDQIQFLRYLPLLKQRGAHVILACRAALRRLFSAAPGIDQIIAPDRDDAYTEIIFPAGTIHEHIPILSLPALLGTHSVESIPADIPYLTPEPERVAHWRHQLGDKPGLKVGIIWRGNRNHGHDDIRSLEAGMLLPLAGLTDVRLVALQKDAEPGEATLLGAEDLAAELTDLAETAAIMACLDLIITVDSAPAHLAGALGRPVWVMLPMGGDWRWGEKGTTTPWYPTARLFRQSVRGDWGTMIAQITTALAALADGTAATTDNAQEPVGPAILGLSPADVIARASHHHKAGRKDEAEALCRAVLDVLPDHADARHLLGVAELDRGAFQAAAATIAHAVELDPTAALYRCNLGVALHKSGDLPSAKAAFGHALRLKPAYADALNNLGAVLDDEDRHAEALAAFRAAIALRPDHANAYNNTGAALRHLKRADEAIAAFRHAIALKPEMVQAHGNLALALHDKGDLAGAIAAYDAALVHRPDHAEARWGRALALLTAGDFTRGLPDYEWRWRVPGHPPPRQFAQPMWDGTILAGRRLLLHTEQGIGDVLQFVRYAPLVAAQGLRVMLEAPTQLIRLLQSLPGLSYLIEAGAPLPHFDIHAPLLSLPGLCGTRLESIPAALPYLAPPPELASQWAQRLAARPGLKAGLVWRGNPGHKSDGQRSMAPELLAPLLAVPGISWLSLQKDARPEELVALGGLVEDVGAQLADFADTAAVIANLDLVITVDTSVAHLAGALGKTVWILLATNPDWRWMLDRADSPWYPCARLFRQNAPEDWPTVISAVTAALERITKG